MALFGNRDGAGHAMEQLIRRLDDPPLFVATKVTAREHRPRIFGPRRRPMRCSPGQHPHNLRLNIRTVKDRAKKMFFAGPRNFSRPPTISVSAWWEVRRCGGHS